MRKMDYSSVYKPESMNPIYRVTDHSVLSAKECSLGIQVKSLRADGYYIRLTKPQTHVLENRLLPSYFDVTKNI